MTDGITSVGDITISTQLCNIEINIRLLYTDTVSLHIREMKLSYYYLISFIYITVSSPIKAFSHMKLTAASQTTLSSASQNTLPRHMR